MKILIDTNVLLDSLLEREPFIANATQVFDLIEKQKHIAYLTATSITDIYYLSKKQLDSSSSALDLIKKIIAVFEIASIDKNVIKKAAELDFKDFEDAVQYQSAKNENIDIIITRNQKDFKKSSIKILSPVQFLKQFNK